MIRSFIFDIGNVLIPFDYNRALRRIASQCALPLETLSPEARTLANAYESGKIDRAEFLHKIRTHFHYNGNEAEFIAAWQDIFWENPPMNDLVAQLRKHYPLYLLSNIGDIHTCYIKAKYPVFAAFSGAVYSYLAGCMKPDPAIFEMAIHDFGVNPAETVYIDDLPANVESAARAGFHAIAYDYKQHERLLEQLAALEVVVE